MNVGVDTLVITASTTYYFYFFMRC